ncbi:DUF5060 domain-containing protein [Xanthocytophaga flava]|nr:DUF5060 domain-containing protein [Xanthocytophaga flavus]
MKRFFIIVSMCMFQIYTVVAGSIQAPVLNKTSFQQYEKVELTFQISQAYSNPYDPDSVKVDAEITTPGNKTVVVPCFYYIPATFTMNSATESAAGAAWKLRYTPVLAGSYQIRIKIVDGTTTGSDPISFTVTAGSEKGFVRIDAGNKQFMRFDNQTPYYPVGYNLCWNNGNLVDFYHTWIAQRMNPNGVNWMRYWLTDFARQALEWKPGHWSGWYSGLGKYSQSAAGILDSTVALCEANGVYMQLVLQHHGQYSTKVNPEWADNPYNTANGGFLANAGDFFTNADAKKQTQKMYRYIVARWGYSPAIMSWELFNEVEYSDGTNTAIDNWHDEMSQYLKSVDVNQHIVNTSSGKDNSTLPLLNDNVAMDQLQWHTYSGSIEKVVYNQIQTFIPYTKSMMNGEFGSGTEYPQNGSHPDNWGDHVRKTMWTSMMSGAPAMFWFWDTYIEAKGLYSMYKPLSQFMNGIDIVRETDGVSRKIPFANNPAIVGTVNVAPGVSDWSGTNSPDPFTSTIDASGNASNTATLTNYIHGSWQNRNRDLRFTVTFQGTGSVTLQVNDLSGSGTKTIEVYVDNTLKTTWNVTAKGAFTVGSIPAGQHVIRLFNSGQDWVQFGQIQFSNVAIRPLEAFGFTGTKKAYGYVNNTTYGEWADSTTITAISGASLKIGKVEKGIYDVSFMNPVTSDLITQNQITVTTDSLTIPLPSFRKDLAYKIAYVSSGPTATEKNTSTFGLLYPNPSGNYLVIEVEDANTIRSVVAYTLLGTPYKLPYTTQGNKCYVNTSQLPSGQYCLTYTARNGRKASSRIIKQ